jgi:hypothetical protein
VEWLAGRVSRCYKSEHSGSETKQALSRYKVLTDAITAAREESAHTKAGSVERNVEARQRVRYVLG